MLVFLAEDFFFEEDADEALPLFWDEAGFVVPPLFLVLPDLEDLLFFVFFFFLPFLRKISWISFRSRSRTMKTKASAT